MSKMTAVEWLVQSIFENNTREWADEINQAKLMEREQIEAAYIHKRCLNDQTIECAQNAIDGAEKYYMNTYKRK